MLALGILYWLSVGHFHPEHVVVTSLVGSPSDVIFSRANLSQNFLPDSDNVLKTRAGEKRVVNFNISALTLTDSRIYGLS